MDFLVSRFRLVYYIRLICFWIKIGRITMNLCTHVNQRHLTVIEFTRNCYQTIGWYRTYGNLSKCFQIINDHSLLLNQYLLINWVTSWILYGIGAPGSSLGIYLFFIHSTFISKGVVFVLLYGPIFSDFIVPVILFNSRFCFNF